MRGEGLMEEGGREEVRQEGQTWDVHCHDRRTVRASIWRLSFPFLVPHLHRIAIGYTVSF